VTVEHRAGRRGGAPAIPRLILLVALAWLAAPAASHGEGPPAGTGVVRALVDLTSDDPERREAAVLVLGGTGDPKWRAFLTTLRDGGVYAWERAGRTELVVGGVKSTRGADDVIELLTAYERRPLGTARVAELVEVAADRRLRLAIKPFLDAEEVRAQLRAPDPAVRRGAAVKLGNQPDAKSLELLVEAIRTEPDGRVRRALAEALALARLAHGDAATRTAAALELGGLNASSALPALRRLEADGATSGGERAAARAAIRQLERWALVTTAVETAFQGLSLASILLLMALGLAVVFGLMGVINMAHGELMALGAYTTFVIQGWFRTAWPGAFDAYFLVALPASFLVAGLAGVALERGVIRRLYGRPLETLLLTWGASLIIQQGLRLWFGAANVDVTAPRWLSGGVPLMSGLELPVNRVFIIGLATVCVGGMYALLYRTDAGLRIRAVMQNRAMSGCLGVRAGVVDAGTFGFGAGLAGLAGCALTQIGNVGPSLGQNYIVDSFMVVVTGGVGKLAGTILAAGGIGGLNKGIEPLMGSVFAKVAILVAVMLFLQRRPAGLFPDRGRPADA